MLISNNYDNHKKCINDILQECNDRFIIVSPFLASNIQTLLSEFDFTKVRRIDLITTCKPNDIEQFTKPIQLKSFFNFFKDAYPTIDIRINIDNTLHGKLYISFSGTQSKCLLTSANFTNKGLIVNHEWGTLIEDRNTIEQLLDELYTNIEYSDLSLQRIEKLCLFSEHYLKRYPALKTPAVKIECDVVKDVCADKTSSGLEPQYFLKPIGDTKNPILLEDQDDFSKLYQPLHFAKKPSGIKTGDVVITTGIGCGSLLSYFHVVGSLEESSPEEKRKDPWKERWPWHMEGKNQFPQFGKTWWRFNLNRNSLVDEFIESHPNTPITFAGGYTLGTINLGNDKVRITKDFADFLIQKIKDSVQ